MKTIRYVGGQGLTDKDADRIGRFLEAKFGDTKIKPKAMVAAARPKRSPIHGDFEWDDAQAAELHRIEQAKYYLRKIKVVFINGEEKPPTRAFHNVVVYSDETDTAERAYMPARVVWEQPNLAEQVIADARRELQSWTDRYREYKELADVIPQVEAVIHQLAA